jgi:hypothetical protein
LPGLCGPEELARFFSRNVLAAAMARGSPGDHRVLTCSRLLIADNALKIQSHICSFYHGIGKIAWFIMTGCGERKMLLLPGSQRRYWER